MGIVNPGKTRALITEDGGQLQITIPSNKNLFLILFLAAWLVGWALGEFSVSSTILHIGKDAPNFSFFAVWLVGWTVGGGFAIYVWFFLAFGKEIITMDGSYLSIKKDIFGLGNINQYQYSDVKNLRFNQAVFNYYNRSYQPGLQFWGSLSGNIAFDYGANTYRFAMGVNESEAKVIVQQILKRSPNFAPSDGEQPLNTSS